MTLVSPSTKAGTKQVGLTFLYSSSFYSPLRISIGMISNLILFAMTKAKMALDGCET